MGHLFSRLANIVINKPMSHGDIGFFIDSANRFVRRRLTLHAAAQRRLGLMNFAAWCGNPPFANASHRNAILSLKYLALSTPVLGGLLLNDPLRLALVGDTPQEVDAHIFNIIRGLPKAVYPSLRFLYSHYLASVRCPEFVVLNPNGRYALHYSAEHAPHPDSHVGLSQQRDSLGMPRLAIHLRFSNLDAWSVVVSHDVIDRWLRAHGLGVLEYLCSEQDRHSFVLDHATDGYHQTGTTRMADAPSRGVVNTDCRVHGVPNLYIASGSVLPTSSHANPTFVVAALAARLAHHVTLQLGLRARESPAGRIADITPSRADRQPARIALAPWFLSYC
jgi:hypothetical protein